MSETNQILRCHADAPTLCRAAADEFVAIGAAALAERGRFTVALSGGSTPRALFLLLGQPPFRDQLDWDGVEFFWGDERPVGPEHKDSNYRMARETLLEPLAIRPERVHRMHAEDEDKDLAAKDYEEQIARVFGAKVGGAPPSFDVVLLGMGADGHTASLFPWTAALTETRRWVVPNEVPKLSSRRMTLTRPILNAAANVIFLVAGAEKAAVLAEVLEGPFEPVRLPAQAIRPERGRLLWMVDWPAAARLTNPARQAPPDDADPA